MEKGCSLLSLEPEAPSAQTQRPLPKAFGLHGDVLRASQVVLVVKNLPASAGDTGDEGSIPGWGRCPAGGNGNPLQYSCLENPTDRGAWPAMVHRVANSQT